MLRAIIMRSDADLNTGTASTTYYTIDFDAPRIEEALTRGGSGDGGYERHTLAGVEVLVRAALRLAETEENWDRPTGARRAMK